VPVPVLVMLVIVVAMFVFLERTRWGRMLYAIGGNQEAARLAGIRVERMRVLAYVVSGVLAALGGVLLAARLGRGDVGAGQPFLLEAVAAALIGFAVLGANRPNAFGTFIGAAFVGVLISGLTMMNFPYYTQDFVKGAARARSRGQLLEPLSPCEHAMSACVLTSSTVVRHDGRREESR